MVQRSVKETQSSQKILGNISEAFDDFLDANLFCFAYSDYEDFLDKAQWSFKTCPYEWLKNEKGVII